MITVLGASGFIGQCLTGRLQTLGLERYAPGRDENLAGRPLGHVIYCIGLTADFRTKPFDTVDAHVCKLLEVLRNGDFDSLLYLSSTRLYANAGHPATEEQAIHVFPTDATDLYTISKAMGEAVALQSGRPTRVVRLSNVYGPDLTSDNFLATIVRDAVTTKRVIFQTAPDSAKDYVHVDDVVGGLIDIARGGRERIYNLASGTNVSNGELAEQLRRLTGCTVEFTPDASTVVFPEINIDRMRREFGFVPSRLLHDMPRLVDVYRTYTRGSHG